jgi:hypothetical protein
MDPICSRCGASLAFDIPGGLCPSCLFKAATEDSHADTGLSHLDQPWSADHDGPSLQPGQTFGPYIIDRVLGRGGMGDVYAAQHVDHGRRVAIKLLGQRLTRPEDRERFFKEGELAAAVNHANTVYVFGNEEIAATPVIAMELLPGGTLKDSVRCRGLFGTTEAVDAILQVIAGLEAAHRCGVLHRDVKPSNCFVDVDGTVKVGDFGLSIPAASDPNSAAAAAIFQGTPGFAPPEQLRGEPLDVRADIYAVGATLYYLLTGEAPGGRRGLSALAAGVDITPIRPLTEVRNAIPRRVNAVVMRCLSPQPGARPRSYGDLRDALTPFSSASATPAPIGLRLAARLVDALILVPVVALCLGLLVGSGIVSDQASALLLGLLGPVAAYWTVGDGLFGFTFGKRACRLAVVRTGGERAGLMRAGIRTAVWIAPFALPLALRAFGASTPVTGLAFAGLSVALIVPGRIHEPFASIQDRLSGSQVVLRPSRTAQQSSIGQTRIGLCGAEGRMIGPYHALSTIGPTDAGDLVLGFDPRLKRDVWIHVQRPGERLTRDVSRNVARRTRLRWLDGRRTDTESWDAYEVPTGRALTQLGLPISWDVLRDVLLDLSRELDAMTSDGSTARLSPAHIWITNDNHGKLLDFSAPGAGTTHLAQSPMSFLRDVVDHVLQGTSPTSIPLEASAIRRRLNDGEISTPAELATVLAASTGGANRVTRWQRGMALAAGVLTYVIASGWLGALVAVALSPVADLRSLSPQLVSILAASSCTGLALGWAALLRGGFWLRTFGIAVITADGTQVSRHRAVFRAAVSWGSVLAATLANSFGAPSLALAIGVGQFVAVLHAIDHPARGLHDRLAGTHLVPK